MIIVVCHHNSLDLDLPKRQQCLMLLQPESDSDPLCIGADGTVNLTLDMSTYNVLEVFGLDGEELLVHCNVTEYYTDVQASGQARARFAQRMYDVSMDRSARYFKAELPYVFQVSK